MTLFLNELKKLCGRKQFVLLAAAKLIMQVFTLYAYERNTEEFYYLYEHKDDYEEVVKPVSEDMPVIFYEEKEKGYYPLLRSSKHGHAAFAASKFAVFNVCKQEWRPPDRWIF